MNTLSSAKKAQESQRFLSETLLILAQLCVKKRQISMKIFRKRQKTSCKNEQLYCINQKKQ